MTSLRFHECLLFAISSRRHRNSRGSRCRSHKRKIEAVSPLARARFGCGGAPYMIAPMKYDLDPHEIHMRPSPISARSNSACCGGEWLLTCAPINWRPEHSSWHMSLGSETCSCVPVMGQFIGPWARIAPPVCRSLPAHREVPRVMG